MRERGRSERSRLALARGVPRGASRLARRALDHHAVDGRSSRLAEDSAFLAVVLGPALGRLDEAAEVVRTAADRSDHQLEAGYQVHFALGQVLVFFVKGIKDLAPVTSFWIFSGLMFGAAALFGIRARFYKEKDYTQLSPSLPDRQPKRRMVADLLTRAGGIGPAAARRAAVDRAVFPAAAAYDAVAASSVTDRVRAARVGRRVEVRGVGVLAPFATLPCMW